MNVEGLARACTVYNTFWLPTKGSLGYQFYQGESHIDEVHGSLKAAMQSHMTTLLQRVADNPHTAGGVGHLVALLQAASGGGIVDAAQVGLVSRALA